MPKLITTEHITANELVDWFSKAHAGEKIVYASGRSFAEESSSKHSPPELRLLHNKVQQLAMDGVITLVQKAGGHPRPFPICRWFEYIAIKRKQSEPAWAKGCFIQDSSKPSRPSPTERARARSIKLSCVLSVGSS